MHLLQRMYSYWKRIVGEKKYLYFSIVGRNQSKHAWFIYFYTAF